MQQKITYTGKLTGTIGETAPKEPLGAPFLPLKQVWQVNPEEKAVEPAKDQGGSAKSPATE